MPVYPPPSPSPGDPGELITDDYQYELNGLLMGSGTSLVVERIEGLLGSAKTRRSDQQRSNQHGTLAGPLVFDERTIQFDIKIASHVGAAELEDLLDEISTAFQPPRIADTRIPDTFVYKRPGRAKRCFFGRATRMDGFDSDFNFARGLTEGSVEFVANDPVSYTLDLHSEAMSLGVGVTTDDMTVHNAGNFKEGTPALIFIEGPCTNPIIQNVDDRGRAIRLEVVLPAGDIIQINTETWKVSVSDSGGPYVEDYNIVKSDNQFWRLMPGDNQIVYSRTGSSGTSDLTIQYLDAWSRG